MTVIKVKFYGRKLNLTDQWKVDADGIGKLSQRGDLLQVMNLFMVSFMGAFW